MKYKLLAVSTENQANIGDYIQALAAARFFPGKHDGFIQREKLKEYDGEECKVIMNGWYMHNPVQWPPSGRIHPLFVAFHINATAAEELMSDESVSYLKRHQPIGCRDYFTRDLLLSKGIEAYFSGCLTLTLGGQNLMALGREKTNVTSRIHLYQRKKVRYGMLCITHSGCFRIWISGRALKK